MKAMYKYELAEAAGVSRRTFSKWCRVSLDQLQQLGCVKNSHLLTPAAVRYMCDFYCISLEND